MERIVFVFVIVFVEQTQHHTSRVPVHLQSVAALANQLLRSGTSIGANNAEACNAVSKQHESGCFSKVVGSFE